MTCPVCGSSEEGLPHFGGVCCRACAVFFRRYYLSKKKQIFCTCSSRKDNSHPCRHCRVVKCLAVGMKVSKIQPGRDSVKEKVEPDILLKSFSMASRQLIPRNSPILASTVSNWPSYAQKRLELYGCNVEDLNIYGVTSCIKKDCNLTWQLISTVFPQVEGLGEKDRKCLISNFVPKWWQLEPSIDFTTNMELWKQKGFTVEKAIVQFYSDAGSSSDFLSIFEPFWEFYFHKVIYPIAQKNFDTAELMALIFLMFFDNAYTNISEECGKMCESIRKVILRELRNYEKQKNEEDTDERRFIETIEVLTLIDKGEKKFEEEMLLCDLYNVRIHDDFRELVRDNKI